MITLITGLPGNGKTLFSLWHIKQKAEKETREVYYHNIKDLTLPWQVCDPEKWMDLPHGSIIVLDECQFVFSKKPNGAKLPDYYEQLATHRHRGFDIYLITQHPSLIDNFVRQLVGQHFHAVRKFGLARATVYEWSATNPAPQSLASQKSAIPIKWAYPKEVYGYYKSAEVHTVKRAIPAKLFLAVGFVVLMAGAGYWALDRYQHRYDQSTAADAPGEANGAIPPKPAGRGAAAGAAGVPFDPVEDAKHWIAMQTPRVAGLPHTAPKFDQLTTPTRVPVPAACVQIGTIHRPEAMRCKCYTQDGTPMAVEFNMCLSFAREGYFQEFDPDPGKDRSSARTEKSVAVLSNRPDSPVPSGQALPSGAVVSMDAPPLHPPIGSSKSSAKGADPTIYDGAPNNRSTRAQAGSVAG
jgi:zona occludens toxin